MSDKPPLSMRRVGRQTLIYAGGVLLGRAVSFVMLPFYTRYLRPADYGIMQLVEMTLEVVAILAGTRIASGVFRYYQKAETREEKYKVLSTATIVLFVSFGTVALLTSLAAPWISQLVFGQREHAHLIRLSAATLGVQSLYMVPMAFLRIEGRAERYVSMVSLKVFVQLLLNVLFLAVFGLGVKGVFLSTLLANITLAVALFTPFVARVGVHFSRMWARSLLLYGLPLIGTHVAAFVATFGDRYFLRVNSDVAAVGIYSLAYQFGFILIALGYEPFTLMWEPTRFEVARRPDKDRTFARAFIYMNLLLLSMALAIALAVGDFIRVMSDPAFHAAAALVPVVLLAYVLYAWAGFHEVGVLVQERTGFVAAANWVGAFVAIVGYALLIPRLLGLGAALATIIAFSARFIVTYAASQRLWPVQYEWGPVLKLVALAVGSYLLSLLIPQDVLWRSIALRAAVFVAYAAAVWMLGLLPEDGKARARELARRYRFRSAS